MVPHAWPWTAAGTSTYIGVFWDYKVVKETLRPGGKYAQTTIAKDLDAPSGVAVDASGNVYIAAAVDNQILKETPQPGGKHKHSVIAEIGLNEAGGVAVDAHGNVYVADTVNSRVLKLCRAGL